MAWKGALGAQSLLTQSVWTGVKIMIGYRAIQEGAEPWLLVLLTAVFAAPALAAAVPAGRATDRWGGTGMAALGSLVCAAGIAVVLVLPGLGWLLTASAIVGLGNLMSMVGQQTFVVHVHAGGSTDGAFGFFSAMASAGQAVGPLLVTTFAAASTVGEAATNTSPGLLVCLILCLVGALAFWPMRAAERTWSLASTRPAVVTPGKQPGRVPLRGVWPSLVVSGIVLVTMDLLYTFVPAWGVENGVGTVAVGMLLSLRALVSMVSRVGLTFLVRRFGRRTLIIVSCALAAIALALLPHAGLPGAVVLMVLMGIGLGIPQPLTMAWAVALTRPQLHGAVLGLRLSANRLAQICLPLALGAFAAPLGSAAVFSSLAVLLTGASTLSWFRRDADA